MTSGDDLSPTKRALLALKQLQAKLDALESAKHEPIAIIGIGCRFPGGVDSPQSFWELLHDRVDAITDVPDDRWNRLAYYDADPATPGKMYTRQGGFVPHPYDFDAPFFRLSPREAISLDPQQRLLLEVGWESLEQAGIAPDSLLGKSGGVFVGICGVDYWHQLLSQSPDRIDAYLTTGNTHSIAAGRLSYLLGWTGASLAIDAACASSLVAVHLACQSLRSQECDLALAGGVNRILTPETSINFSKAKMLSQDDRCRSFDAAASGFVRSEGCGMVVLKRLSDAIAAQDTIQAVILGSAVNHDGRTSGLTVPNGLAQQAVIRQALAASRIEPEQVSYLEAHGTATALGDPIEAEAIGAVFGKRSEPLWLGCVKTNIGHLEAAAGIAGLIKTVLALQHQAIPANLHFQTPNPQIDWDQLPLNVPTRSIAWNLEPTAGVSAFGFSGTNAHVILSAAPIVPAREADDDAPYLFTLSARSEPALKALVQRYVAHLTAYPNLPIADLCFTANTGRSHLVYRLAIVTDSLADLSKKLTDWLAGKGGIDVIQGRAQAIDPDDSLASLYEQKNRQALRNLAQRYVQGASIRWTELHSNGGRIALPTYPFQRQRYEISIERSKR